MVEIPEEVVKAASEQKVLVVGSVDVNGIVNVSPRTSFLIRNDSIHWIDFFQHKSRHNFEIVPWVSIAIFDKSNLTGFQLKGKASIVQDEKEKKFYTDLIARSTTGKTQLEIFDRLCSKQPPLLIRFIPRVVYSLAPQESSGDPLVQDEDLETIRLLGLQQKSSSSQGAKNT